MEEIGACVAMLNKITTTVDGGVRITIDLNPDNSELIKKLFDLKMSEEPEVYVGFSRG